MKENINFLLKKLINKAFPEFSNKVTWTLITVGIGILALPAPTYLLFINLVIDSYNKKTNSKINLIEINNITPSSGIALTLIIAGLIYHLIIKGFQIYSEIIKENNDKEIQKNRRTADISLYEKFIDLFPLTSFSVRLLKDQDFGNPYHENAVKDFDKLKYGWGHANQHFHDQEIEDKSKMLYQEINKFNAFLANNTNYINQGPLISMLTDWDRAMDMEWEPQTEANVKKANEWGSEIHAIYCDFIDSTRKKLAI